MQRSVLFSSLVRQNSHRQNRNMVTKTGSVTGLNSVHLGKGSKCPPPPARDQLRMYSMRFCPYAQRTLLAVLAKQIPCEIVNIDLWQKPEWLAALNPLQKMPVLEYNGDVIFESAICNEWLDATFPHNRPILPSGASNVAREKIKSEMMNSLSRAFYALLSVEPDQKLEKAQKVKDRLRDCEQILIGDFYAGSEAGFTDYMIWPFLERLPVIDFFVPEANVALHIQGLPKLGPYVQRMQTLDEVKISRVDDEIHAEFIMSLKAGAPGYNTITAKL